MDANPKHGQPALTAEQMAAIDAAGRHVLHSRPPRLPAKKPKRRPHAENSWVSKTNMADYHRCPHAFWLLDKGEIKRARGGQSLRMRLISEGIAFQERVEAAATPLAIEPTQVPELFSRDLTVYGVPGFKNHELRIRVSPTGSRPPRGRSTRSR